ncbi:MAG: hypothetical protein ABIM30_07765 [candidate division WOR-3 bacterium]
MSRKKSVFWGLFFSYVNLLFPIFTGIVLVPFYLKQIPTELYGAWLASGGVLGWLAAVDPGISVVVQQKVGYHFGKKEFEKLLSYAKGGIFLTYLLSLVILLAGFTACLLLTSIFHLENKEHIFLIKINFIIALLATLFQFISFSYSSVIIGLLKVLDFGAATVFSNIFGIGISIWLLANQKGLFAISCGMLARSTLLLALSILLYVKHIKFCLGTVYFKNAVSCVISDISFSAISRFAVLITQNLDQILIAKFMGTGAVPAYVFSSRGMNLCSTFMTRIGHAIAPGLSNLFGEGNKNKIIFITNHLLDFTAFMIGGFICLFLSLNRSFVLLWVGENFFVGTILSGLMVFSVALSVLKSILHTIILNSGEIKFSLTVQAADAFLIGITMLVLIPKFGYFGALIPFIVIPLICSIPLYGIKIINLLSHEKNVSPISLISFSTFFPIIAGIIIGLIFKTNSSNFFHFALHSFFIAFLYIAIHLLYHKNHRAFFIRMINAI